jgi:UDP-2,4-diacetamido-2,4,6-trideoxy-beta-L-altropyranose hydrolase
MNIIFRVDASLSIGSGHVMRCLTLANALKLRGHSCEFVCVNHAGNMIADIYAEQFKIHILPERETSYVTDGNEYARWLGCSQQEDRLLTANSIDLELTDWIVVDNYALSKEWESFFVKKGIKVFVIDDLADRPHQCDLLLDQTFGRIVADYRNLILPSSRLLVGAEYSLLRPEFSILRNNALSKRSKQKIGKILISLGGIDEHNVTERILNALNDLSLPNIELTVVLGKHCPWRKDITRLAEVMSMPTKILVNVRDMALLMASSDFAIGAAGSTTWERCCLGLPSALIAIAENQEFSLSVLENSRIVHKLDLKNLELNIIDFFQMDNLEKLIQELSENCRSIVDGGGVDKVINVMEDVHGM